MAQKPIDISPTRADGSWKSGDECFIEAFNKVSQLSAPRPTTSVFDGKSVSSKDLATKMIGTFGADWVKWLPETTRAEVAREFGDVTESILQKIFAIKVLFSSDDFWNDVHVFQNIVLAMNEVYPDFGYFQEISPAQVVHGINEVSSIRRFPFDQIINSYIRNILFDHGLFIVPENLRHLDLDMAGISEEGLGLADEETFEGIQAAKLNAINIYLEEMKNGH